MNVLIRKRSLLPALVLIALTTLSVPAQASRPFRGGAVATPHPYATEAAVRMLELGGNAVDAAVAAAFVLAVATPYHSGLGGGGFALVHDARGTRALDFREVAPAAATETMYLRDGEVVPRLSTEGGLAVAVPGAVAGYLELLEEGGRLSRATVLEPAIRVAEEGFWVSPKYRAVTDARIDCLRADAASSELFLRPSAAAGAAASGADAAVGDDAHVVPAIGTLIRQPALARTLRALRERGPDAFYRGSLATALVEATRRRGGILTLEDLTSYRPRWREPLIGTYRGHRVATMPPPSAGGVTLLQTLWSLERHAPDGLDRRDPGGLHHLVESLRRAYAARTRYLGDPDFVEVPASALLAPDYLTRLFGDIDPGRATPSERLTLPDVRTGARAPVLPSGSAAGPKDAPERHTSHLSVIDKAGNAVSLTTTVNYWFGACVTVPGSGVVLNNEMDDFNAAPGVANLYGLTSSGANAVAPGKVPLSSMTPTLVFQKGAPGAVLLATGSPGGSTIPTTVLQTVLGVVDHGMNAAQAAGAGRIHHQFLPDRVRVDAYGLEPATAARLEALGHTLEGRSGWGDAEVVLVDPTTGLRYSASDPRNEGAAGGQD